MYDMSDEQPLTEAEIIEIRSEARETLRIRSWRALFFVAAFLIACAVTVLCLDGFPLHEYWMEIGRPAVIVAELILVLCLLQAALLVSAWFYHRDLEKQYGGDGRPPRS